MMRLNRLSLTVCSTVILILLVACSNRSIFDPQKQEGDEFYRPPVASFSPATPSPQPTLLDTTTLPLVTPLPSPTPTCANQLTFLEDVTLPDGSQVEPAASLDKRWLVQNSGDCNWDERYSLRLVSGPDLGAPASQSLVPARGGAQATLRILFTAPNEPGSYRSAWQAYDPDGQPFGDLFFIEVVVTKP